MTSRENEPVTRFLVARVAGADATSALPPPPPTPESTVASVAAALRKRAQQRRKRTWLVRGSLAATILVLVGAAALAQRGHHGNALASKAGAAEHEWLALGPSASAVPGETRWVPQGARIRTDVAGTTLSFHEVTQVSVHEHSSVELVLQGRTNVLHLDQGSLSAHVKKLTPDERFVVRTPDAEVEVRGTVFHVTVVPSDTACGDGTTTRVSVDEGTVVVRRGGQEHAVHVGEVWPPACARGRIEPPQYIAPLIASSAQRPLNSASTLHESPPSSLAAQNDRFASAMALKKRGDARGAVNTLDGLIHDYPTGPLAESALVERMKLLETFDAPRARSAAGDYLRAYPNGFGRAHARGLVGDAP